VNPATRTSKGALAEIGVLADALSIRAAGVWENEMTAGVLDKDVKMSRPPTRILVIVGISAGGNCLILLLPKARDPAR
jgi:hypothetical protein